MKKTIPDLIVMSMFLIAVGLWFYGVGYWAYREHRLDQGTIPCHICGEWFPYHKPGTRPLFLGATCPDCRTKFKLEINPKNK